LAYGGSFGEDALGPRLVADLGAAVVAYGLQSWQKKKPAHAGPVVTTAGLLAAGAVTRSLTGRPYLYALAEAMETGGAWGLGTWAADVTPTIGGVGAGVPQVWQPFVGGSSSSAVRNVGAARRALPVATRPPVVVPQMPATPTFVSDQAEDY
jgi:hypothetical protein